MHNPIAIPCFNDNYIWLIATQTGCWVVDPGDAKPVTAWLKAHQQRLSGILLTHHHADHVGGVQALVELARTKNQTLSIWGPDECHRWRSLPAITGETQRVTGLGNFTVLDVSAHTLGHIAYYFAEHGWLFCGDSLFSAGCGRLFEGTPQQLHQALQRINALPSDTKLFPAHEYTLKNLAFAQCVEPQNGAVANAILEVEALRERNEPSLPTTLARERNINPFLRLHSKALQAQVAEHTGQAFHTEENTLALLRQWKDQH